MEFVKTSVSWISSKDILDTCFILNYGYEAPLPWPQVKFKLFLGPLSSINNIYLHKQVVMRLDDEDKKNETKIEIEKLQLVPGSKGMNVPSTCTVVIIAGINIKQKIRQH